MSDTPTIHQGDVGTVLTLTVTEGGIAANISGATTKQFLFEDPNGVVTAKTAAYLTDGTDGKLTYTTVAGDFATAGTWKWEARLAWTSPTRDWKTEIGNLEVLPVLTPAA